MKIYRKTNLFSCKKVGFFCCCFLNEEEENMSRITEEKKDTYLYGWADPDEIRGLSRPARTAVENGKLSVISETTNAAFQ